MVDPLVVSTWHRHPLPAKSTGSAAWRSRPSGRFDWSSRRQHNAGGKHEEGIVADKYNGYCVKCKEKRDFDGRVEVSKTGMKMAKGSCPVCGTTVNRILGKA
ncbi:MAG: hypothetical protein QOI74_37 [Micromonosporaceae bacterium]|nr:hypothetical protein [Micromonosporaceae bacterium]MDT5036824.1 hypothetical protein [Micromonosporaceae bacterium]